MWLRQLFVSIMVVACRCAAVLRRTNRRQIAPNLGSNLEIECAIDWQCLVGQIKHASVAHMSRETVPELYYVSQDLCINELQRLCSSLTTTMTIQLFDVDHQVCSMHK